MKQKTPPLPGYICRAAEELMDERIRNLSLAERGLVEGVKRLCWTNGSAPIEPSKIARMLGCKERDVSHAMTPAVIAIFSQERTGDGVRLMSPELEQEKAVQLRRKRQLSEAGSRGAAALHSRLENAGQATATPEPSHGQAMAGSKEGRNEGIAEAPILSTEESRERIATITTMLAKEKKIA